VGFAEEKPQEDSLLNWLNSLSETSMVQTHWEKQSRVMAAGSGLKLEITEQEAKEVFDKLASRFWIPFHYRPEGCYARAHRMAQILEQKKIYSQKVFLEGFLVVDGIAWSWHVAPMVFVRTNTDELESWVIDPSLFNGPVPFAEWRLRQTNQECFHVSLRMFEKIIYSDSDGLNSTCVYYRAERFAYKPTDTFNHPNKWLKKDQKDMLKHMVINRFRRKR